MSITQIIAYTTNTTAAITKVHRNIYDATCCHNGSQAIISNAVIT